MTLYTQHKILDHSLDRLKQKLIRQAQSDRRRLDRSALYPSPDYHLLQARIEELATTINGKKLQGKPYAYTLHKLIVLKNKIGGLM